MLNRNELNELLAEAGVTGETVKLVLAATGRQRHVLRVSEAFSAAAAYLDNDGWYFANVGQHDLVAQFLCACESEGLFGGGFSNPGAASIRHPAFAGLPRHQQRSGAAWDAALRDAGRGVSVAIVRDAAYNYPVVQLSKDGEYVFLGAEGLVKALTPEGAKTWLVRHLLAANEASDEVGLVHVAKLLEEISALELESEINAAADATACV